MITPRTTRLVRVPDLRAFRQSLATLACEGTPFEIRNRLVVVPTRAAAAYLLQSIESRLLLHDSALVLPDLITPGELIARMGERLPQHAGILTETEREVLAGVASRMALEEGYEPPFRLRAGLIAEAVRFYDALRRNLKGPETFERLALGKLEPGAAEDRGAERLVRQTHFLANMFRHFERLVSATGRLDEHALRRQLINEHAADPWRHIVLAVGDHAIDRQGLFPADWDLLTQIPGLERIDVVATEGAVAGVFHERIHERLPGVEEIRTQADDSGRSPVLLVPSGDALTHTARDREEEVAGFARWVRREMRSGNADAISAADRMALVVYRPLPYVYLAREVLRSAGIPSQMFDALPLASEPYAAALDLVIDFVRGQGGRSRGIALLRSPHFAFGPEDVPLSARDVTALDRALSDAGYLGGSDALERLVIGWRVAGSGSRYRRALRAGEALVQINRDLASLRTPASCGGHLDRLIAFLRRHERLPRQDDPIRSRLLRGRAAVFEVFTSLSQAYAQFDLTDIDFNAVAAVIKRWIEAHTFSPRNGEDGVHVVDAESAKFGDFDGVQLAGLVDGEWPETPHRNIFYPPSLLRELGWPVESDRLDGVRALFGDLLRLPSSCLVVSAFTLEEDAVVAASTLVDALPVAGLETRVEVMPTTRIFEIEALGLEPVETSHLGAFAAVAATRRIGAISRRPVGQTSGHMASSYSPSGLERYQDCPFKFFAADVLKLKEPPEDEPMRSPRARGGFVHEVFERFFDAWDTRGDRTITVDRVDEARRLFQEVTDPLLARFSEAEAALERDRLFGTAVSIGFVDVVIGLEVSQSAPVQERWLEEPLEGKFSLGVPGGRKIPLKGKADRIDLLEGNRLRVIDYKSGRSPEKKRTLQVAIYALCAQERLGERDGRVWDIDEAAYVMVTGKQPPLRVVQSGAPDRDRVLKSVRERAIELVDGIEGGTFPPRPHQTRLCDHCAYPSVCRKDYVW